MTHERLARLEEEVRKNRDNCDTEADAYFAELFDNCLGLIAAYKTLEDELIQMTVNAERERLEKETLKKRAAELEIILFS